MPFAGLAGSFRSSASRSADDAVLTGVARAAMYRGGWRLAWRSLGGASRPTIYRWRRPARC